MEVSVEDEIRQVEMRRPHVVILGAGASRAAFPNGERNGRQLPLMADFTQIVPVGDVFKRIGIDPADQDFESLYSQLTNDPNHDTVREELESIVYSYFDSLALPDFPTLYDHILLSLRDKDVIATFNWDPFLIQAARRNPPLRGRQPRLLFLHGNVLAGFCERDNVHGVRRTRCSRCQRPFSPSRLLYPVAEKDYDTDPMIADAWRALRQALKGAFMVTVFGYSAPTSDASAVQLLQAAWGSWRERQLEQFEIIDIRQEDKLRESWSSFIHTHHYEVHSDPYDSWILNHPRRTGEAYLNQYLQAYFIVNHRVPRDVSFAELWAWFQPLFEAEEQVSR